MLAALAKLLKVLNAEGNPSQISFGFVMGMIVGLTPFWNFHNLVFGLLAFLFRINLAAFILSLTTFSAIAYLADPMMETIGVNLLTSPSLKDVWTSLYSQTFWRLTHFNNTLTLGSLVSALVLSLPFFFLSNFIIKNYRQHLLIWVRKSRLVQMIKANRFFRIYQALSGSD